MAEAHSYYKFTSSCLSAALSEALLMLARTHDNRPGPWLDEFERRIVDEIGNSKAGDLIADRREEYATGAADVVKCATDAVRLALRSGVCLSAPWLNRPRALTSSLGI